MQIDVVSSETAAVASMMTMVFFEEMIPTSTCQKWCHHRHHRHHRWVNGVDFLHKLIAPVSFWDAAAAAAVSKVELVAIDAVIVYHSHRRDIDDTVEVAGNLCNEQKRILHFQVAAN